MQSRTNKTLHDSRRTPEKSKVLRQIKQTAENSNCYSTCHVFSLKDTLAHIANSDPRKKVGKSRPVGFIQFAALASDKSFTCQFIFLDCIIF